MTIVTTSRTPRTQDWELATQMARQLQGRTVERRNLPLHRLMKEAGSDDVIVVSGGTAKWQNLQGDTFFFHPSMASLRIKHLSKAEKDNLMDVAGIRQGSRVLDCTLGLASDAIVAAYVAGEAGLVVGLESVPTVAALVRQGLRMSEYPSRRLTEAMRRIQVVQADYREYLPQCEDHAFDVVLFDPMFRKTVHRSQAIQSLKAIANPAPLDVESVQEATRVASSKVVLKERKGSPEFERLGFRVIKEASTYALGVINTG